MADHICITVETLLQPSVTILLLLLLQQPPGETLLGGKVLSEESEVDDSKSHNLSVRGELIGCFLLDLACVQT